MQLVLFVDEPDRKACREMSNDAADAGADRERRANRRLQLIRHRSAGNRHVDDEAFVIGTSAKVSDERGSAGTTRGVFLKSAILGSFRFPSSQVSLLASLSRVASLTSSSSRKLPGLVSLMRPSSLPKSRK